MLRDREQHLRLGVGQFEFSRRLMLDSGVLHTMYRT
jgi:hypothetical protein